MRPAPVRAGAADGSGLADLASFRMDLPTAAKRLFCRRMELPRRATMDMVSKVGILFLLGVFAIGR